MQQIIPRDRLLATIRTQLAEAPSVALLGARQVGKTTLARQIARAWAGPTVTFDLERPADRETMQATPDKVLSGCEGLVILDEIQRRSVACRS